MRYRWIRLDFEVLWTKMTAHSKLPDRRRVVHSNLGLLCVVTHTLCDVNTASSTPDVVGHFKSSDETVEQC